MKGIKYAVLAVGFLMLSSIDWHFFPSQEGAAIMEYGIGLIFVTLAVISD